MTNIYSTRQTLSAAVLGFATLAAQPAAVAQTGSDGPASKPASKSTAAATSKSGGKAVKAPTKEWPSKSTPRSPSRATAKAAGASKGSRKAAAAKPAEIAPPEAAGAEQIDAAGRVYYGLYECEFNQTIRIVENAKFPAYVDVKHGKFDYLMKPVLSSTGAIRLEDVRGETLMVQIATKSMLLNVKTAQRIVDDCITPKQRELVEAARAAKAAELAAGNQLPASAGATSAAASAADSTAVAVPPPVAASAAASAPTSSMTTQTRSQTQ